MMENRKKIITKIPADIRKTQRVEPGRKLKVAAYCRVSTDADDQLNSYYAQMTYYRQQIQSNDKWQFAGIYADEGITGTQVRKRDQFLKMIKDCEKGKIDMILTKSVSRFARNIVDSLSFVRKLKAMGISIYFEEQNIDSLKEDSETYIGIHSVMAQSESENISANVKWGISKRMENGTYRSNMNMYGYRRDKITDEVKIVPEEAEVVRTIFRYYLDGMSTHQIKKYLEDNNIKTYSGLSTWQHSSIVSILQNEKYCGDVIYQKTYHLDCLSKKVKVNNGDRTKYHIMNDHEPIVSRDLFYAVQAEFAKRNTKRSVSDKAATIRGRYSGKYAFSELLVCGTCNGRYRRKTVKKNGVPFHYWRCINRLDYADKYCSNSVGLEEEALKAAVCRALSRILRQRDEGFEVVKSSLIYSASSESKADDLFFVDKAIRDEETRIIEYGKLAISSEHKEDDYKLAIKDSSERIESLNTQREQIVRQLSCNDAAKKEMERIEKYLLEDRAVVDTYNDSTVRRLISSIEVTPELDLKIYIKGGYEITEKYTPVKNAE